MMANIINRNFFQLLRSGAFSHQGEIEPMSAFKWKRILQLADAQNVMPYIIRGFSNYSEHPKLSLTPSLQTELERIGKPVPPDVNAIILKVMQANPLPSNFILKRKFRKMMEKEEESEDFSLETQQLLYLIIYNVNQMLTKGIPLRGIIELGRYLRTKGDRVDFVKLEHWLHQIGFVRLASLQGTILIELFQFDLNELPFMQQEEENAVPLAHRSLYNVAFDTAENWHFRMRTNGMVENNSRVLRRNLRRSIRYVRYNPFETVSNFMANFARSLSEIEE